MGGSKFDVRGLSFGDLAVGPKFKVEGCEVKS
jgi:hypothetical protein